MVMIKQSFLIAAKDMKQFFKDRFGVAFALAFPLLFVVAFSAALGDVGPGDDDLTLAVGLRDGDMLGGLVVRGMAADPQAGLSVLDYDVAAAEVADGTLQGFVAFPVGFDVRLQAGEFPPLEIVLGNDDIATEFALRGLARDIRGRVGTVGLALEAAASIGGSGVVDLAAIAEVSKAEPVLSFAREQVGGVEAIGASSLTLPGYLTMFVFFAAALSAEAIARERKNHTLERLLSNGTTRSAILFGKFLSSVFRGGMQLAVLWGMGLIAFGIDIGASPAAVIVVSILMVLASSAFGVMLASMVDSVRTASSAAVLASLSMAALGGSWWPLFIAPDWQQQIAKVTPHAWANTAFNKLLLFGAEGSEVVLEMAALSLFTVAFMAIAIAKFRTAPTS